MPVLYWIQAPSHMPRRGLGGGNSESQGRAKHTRNAIIVVDDDNVIVLDDEEAPRQAPFQGPSAADIATLRTVVALPWLLGPGSYCVCMVIVGCRPFTTIQTCALSVPN